MDLTAQLSALLGNKPASGDTSSQPQATPPVLPQSPVSSTAASVATPVAATAGSIPSAITTPVKDSSTPTLATASVPAPQLPTSADTNAPASPVSTITEPPIPPATAPILPPLPSTSTVSSSTPPVATDTQNKDQNTPATLEAEKKSELPPLPAQAAPLEDTNQNKEPATSSLPEKPKDPVADLPTPPQPPLSDVAKETKNENPLEKAEKKIDSALPPLPDTATPNTSPSTPLEVDKKNELPPLPETKDQIQKLEEKSSSAEVKEIKTDVTEPQDAKPEEKEKTEIPVIVAPAKTEEAPKAEKVAVPELPKVEPPKPERKIDASKMKFWAESQKTLEELEKSWNARVIAVYIPMNGKLSNATVNEMHYHVSRLGKEGKVDRLALVIYGPGGKGTAALRLVKMIRSYVNYLIVAVPDIAASAMTMLAVGADQLVMSPIAMLSPVDTSVTHPLAPRSHGQSNMPVSIEITQIKKYLEMVKADNYHNSPNFNDTAEAVLSEHVHPIVLGHMQRAATLSTMITEKILSIHMKDKAKVAFIAKTLSEEFPSHDFPIFMDDVLAMGLNASAMSAEDIEKCASLFEYYKVLTTDVSSVDGNKKLMVARTAVIESTDLRSWFHNEETLQQKEDGKWTRMSEYHDFMRAIPMKVKENEYTVKPATFAQFKEWLKNGEVEDKQA
ncbi:MAG: hypothetical protein QY314_03610 [Candidatus Dojkabacteria bacterium]|nr:MAG: hypothetical protein QY314_03610 [Candidatus Dojkabacteria bacterium]